MFKKIAYLAAIVIGTVVVSSGTAHAQRYDQRACEPTVDQILARIPDIADRIERISYNRQRAHGDGAENRTIGWDVRVQLADFDGTLVIDITNRCHTRQVYTRGKDTLPDIKAHCA